MNKLFCPVLLVCLIAVAGHAQPYPQGLIYCAQINVTHKTVCELYDENGRKIFDKPVSRAYCNVWDWIFVVDRNTELGMAYDYTGKPLGIDSIESSRTVGLYDARIGIKRHGKWRFYDKTGRQMIADEFDDVTGFSEGISAVKSGGNVYFIDTMGRAVQKDYDSSDVQYRFEDGDIVVGMSGFENSAFKIVKKNGKCGLKTPAGKLVVPIAYDEILSLKEHFEQVTVKLKGEYGVFSFKSQKLVIPIKYNSVFVLNDYLMQ